MPDATEMPPRRISLSVSAADKARSGYLCVPFDVPEGATRFDLRYSYPRSGGCVIDLGLGDPDLTGFPSAGGLVGWSGGARDAVFVAASSATPGYRPGIRPGRWQAILGLYRLPDHPVPVTIDVAFDATPRTAARRRTPPAPTPRGPGWYRGDLQCHTHHSDARGSPEALHATARRERLDFLAVTDHNTTTAHAAYFDAATGRDLVFVPAWEFTTERGHGNVFGARRVEDFRVAGDADVLDMVRRIRARGHLFSINHDKPDIPWRYPLPEVDCMEVWQAPWLAGNHVALERYQARLAAGRRLTAIGGSDFHQPEREPPGNLATLARPCTYLHCAELSERGILDALSAGRSFVTEAPDGPRLILTSGEAGHGGEIAAGMPVRLTWRATGAAGDLLEVWDATGRIASAPIPADDVADDLPLPPVRGFLRGQIVARASRAGIVAAARAHVAQGRGGRMDWDGAWDRPVIRALTSPIYVV